MMRAAWTLPPTRSGPVCLGFGGGGAPPMPPMTPPSTPPMEPPATPPGTTAHAGSHFRLSIFLNNLDFLGDDLRLHQFACIHQMSLRLDMYHLSHRGRRWRRRWRRRRGEHSRHHGLRKRLGVDQRNEYEYSQKGDLKYHRKEDRPRLAGLLRIRTGNHHFFKHGSYLLPAGARRPATFSLPRALLPVAGPGPAAAPW